MRPAHKSISAGVWKFEGRLVSHFEAALFREHPNLVLRPLPFRRSPSDSQLLFIPKTGKGLHVNRIIAEIRAAIRDKKKNL